MKKRFVPLECNPQVFNDLMYSMGVSNAVEFYDVYSIDEPDLLALLPRPVWALILAFPVTESYENYRKASDKDLADDFYNDIAGTDKEDALWFKQTIGNACGTMALIHALSNGLPVTFIKPGSPIDDIIEKSRGSNVSQRVSILEDDDSLESCHAKVANEGDTAAPSADAEVEHHYVCITRARKSGNLVELDGRRKGPVDLGELDPLKDMLSEAPLAVAKSFLEREGKSGQFSIIALAPALDTV